MKKKMIIVGAGIAGLSTGCYAQMNGYDTMISESHDIPGGLCTAWKRKGYTFDISMHMLVGSLNGPFKKMWDELEVTKNQEFYYHKSLLMVEGQGNKLDLCIDKKRLQEQMLRISPADARLIKEFTGIFLGRSLMNTAPLDAPESQGAGQKFRMAISILPFLNVLMKYGKLTLQEFVGRVKDPFIAKAMQSVVDSPGWPMPRYPMAALSGFAAAACGEAGYPLGGSKRVAQKLAAFYERLGGRIHYGNRVADVLTDNDKAIGVVTKDGKVHMADIVVWAADGHHLIFDILRGRYMDDVISEMYSKWLVVKPMVQVCIGVDMDLSDQPQKIIYELEKPVVVAGEEFKWINIMLHAFDKGSAPAGKTSLEVWYATDYLYWENLFKDRTAYQAEKKRIAQDTITALDRKWPGFRSKVEVVDVPTPVTYVRYTGNWQGSVDGWYITPENMMKQQMKRTLPGLENLYMAGHWTAPFTGTVMAALSGRQIVQVLCRKEKRDFVTVPGVVRVEAAGA